MNAIDIGHEYARHGWRIVPLYGMDGDQCRCGRGSLCPPKTRGKHPSLGNQWQKNTLAGGADVQAWYEDHPHDNIGVATGRDSGIWVLDIDGAQGVSTISDLATEHGSLPLTRIVRTGSGGLHYFFRHPADFDVRNSTSWIGPGVDVRGRGGQVVAPPSVSGRGPYEVIADHPVAEAPEWLTRLVREHARYADAGASAEVKGAERVDIEFLPAHVLELASTLVEEDKGRFKHFHAIVAAVYEAGYTQGQAVTIVAPWCAAVKKYVGRIEAEVARSWGKLEMAAAKANEWVDGIAGPTANPTQPTKSPPATDGTSALKTEPDPAEDGDEELPTFEPTWRPVDLTAILDGTYQPEQPSLFPRTDGRSLLYPGRVHSFHGESESGKSLIAQAECARLITNPVGEHVLYIDFESDAAAVVGRLIEMGAPRTDIRTNFTYLRPDNDPRKFSHERDELAAVLQHDLTLIVIDGVTDALGVFGAGSTDNDEIAAFMRAFPRMLARKTGAAVVLVDHVTKDADTRGRYAVGGQAKMNALDGSAFVVEVVEPLGQGRRGVVSMRVAKDRPGGVRPVSGPFRKNDRTQESARVIVDSTNGTIDVTVEPQQGHVDDNHDGKAFRPTVKMEQISRFLEELSEGVSWNTLKDAVGGNEKAARQAVALLHVEGYITVTDGPNRSQIHTSTKPYRVDDEALNEWISAPVTPVTPSDATGDAKNDETGDAKALPPLRGEGVTRATTDPPSDATGDATISETPCRRCGSLWPAAVIALNHGRCGDCT
jgi:hypothetical protein